MQKGLILLVFVSYEAVRLWCYCGNCGVVDFESVLRPVRVPPPYPTIRFLNTATCILQRRPVPVKVPVDLELG